MSLTFKAHGGHDAPWFVVPDPAATDLSSPTSHVEWQKTYLIAAFGLVDVPGIANKTLHELAVICEPLWSGANNVAKLLGATPVADTQPVPAPSPAANVQVQQDAPSAPQAAQQPAPWEDGPAATPEAPAAPEEPAHPHQDVLDQIEAATSKRDIQAIFLANKASFSDAKVAEAAQAKTASF